MKTAKQMVDAINKLEIYSHREIEDEIDFSDVQEVTTLDEDEHRWYVIGTVVYKIGNEFFGVCGPTMLKSESMSYSDVGMECEAFEMEEVQSVTYKAKI